RPWCFTNLRTGQGVQVVEDFLLGQLPPQVARSGV
ncbi:MAG: urease accessory protein UreG, partial [Synechococcus sp. SB0670_bin_20]|nr:urease accessory protein UreG [Synechococcus sp. SB0670_bin_20]